MKTKFTKILRLTLTCFAVLFFGIAVSSKAADYYVSPSGNNNNNGTTPATAFQTISKAALVANAGSVVHVAPGTYAETIITTLIGTPSARIRYVSDIKWGAKIVPVAGAYTMWTASGGYTDIDGFQLDGTGNTSVRIGITLTGGNSSVKNTWAHHIAQNSGCNSQGGAALHCSQYRGTSYNNYDFIGNVVHDVGGGCGYIQGIYHQSSGNIKNNLVYACSYAIHLYHDDHNLNVVNNTVFGNSSYGIVYGGCAEAYNNGCPTSGIKIHNNIIFDNRGGIQGPIASEDVNNEIKNNLVFGNTIQYDLASARVSSITGAVNANPQFVNYIRTGGGDYHLKSTSPAINAGNATYAPAADLDGVIRLGAPDIGAYEFVGPCSLTDTPTAPKGLSATATSSSTINLTWKGKIKKIKKDDDENSNNESAYLVEQSTNATTGFELIASLSSDSTSFSSTGLDLGTTYYYRVRAINCFGSSEYTDVANATPAIICSAQSEPDAPLNTAATAVSYRQIDVSWTDSSDSEENWLVERSATSSKSGFTVIATLPPLAGSGSNTSYSDKTGLSASTTYYYRVYAVNCVGYSKHPAIVNATTIACLAPSVPNPALNMTAAAVSSFQINLSWTDDSSNEDNWLVERSTSSTTGFVQIASLPANTVSYSSTGLTAGTTYYYRVRAENCFGTSLYSNVANATTNACSVTFVPSRPTNLVAISNSETAINLTWSDNSGFETAYLVERSTNATTGFTLIASLIPNTTSYTSTGLTPNTLYYYRVYAMNCFGNSPYSNVANATASATCSVTFVPSTPGNLVAVASSGTVINLTWSDNSGFETAYLVERSTSATTGFTQIASLPANTVSYSSTGLAAGTTYYYRVRAENCFGNSLYSNVANATTPNTISSAPSSTIDISEQEMSKQIILYPNPFSNVLNLKISEEVVLNKAIFKIVDRFGKEVKSVSISSHEIAIDKGKMQSGIYFYNVINNGQTIDKGRLIIQ